MSLQRSVIEGDSMADLSTMSAASRGAVHARQQADTPRNVSFRRKQNNDRKRAAWRRVASADLAEWFNGIFKGDEDIPAFEPSTLLEQLANGIALQELAKRVDHGDAQSNRWAEAAGFRGGGGGGGGGDDAVGSPMTIHKNTLNRRMSSYHKRANLTQFLHWANLLGVPDTTRFEPDDMLEGKNESQVLTHLLSTAGQQTWVAPPQVVAVERAAVDKAEVFTAEMNAEIQALAAATGLNVDLGEPDNRGRYDVFGAGRSHIRLFQFSPTVLGATPSQDEPSRGLRVRTTARQWIPFKTFVELYGEVGADGTDDGVHVPLYHEVNDVTNLDGTSSSLGPNSVGPAQFENPDAYDVPPTPISAHMLSGSFDFGQRDSARSFTAGGAGDPDDPDNPDDPRAMDSTPRNDTVAFTPEVYEVGYSDSASLFTAGGAGDPDNPDDSVDPRAMDSTPRNDTVAFTPEVFEVGYMEHPTGLAPADVDSSTAVARGNTGLPVFPPATAASSAGSTGGAVMYSMTSQFAAKNSSNPGPVVHVSVGSADAVYVVPAGGQSTGGDVAYDAAYADLPQAPGAGYDSNLTLLYATADPVYSTAADGASRTSSYDSNVSPVYANAAEDGGTRAASVSFSDTPGKSVRSTPGSNDGGISQPRRSALTTPGSGVGSGVGGYNRPGVTPIEKSWDLRNQRQQEMITEGWDLDNQAQRMKNNWTPSVQGSPSGSSYRGGDIGDVGFYDGVPAIATVSRGQIDMDDDRDDNRSDRARVRAAPHSTQLDQHPYNAAHGGSGGGGKPSPRAGLVRRRRVIREETVITTCRFITHKTYMAGRPPAPQFEVEVDDRQKTETTTTVRYRQLEPKEVRRLKRGERYVGR